VNLKDTATAPVSRVASAALQTLGLAADLLNEAGQTIGSDAGADALRDAIATVCRTIPTIEHTEQGVTEAVFVASEIVRLCDELAMRHRRSSPAALACARLAEAGAELAVEALTEDRDWATARMLSRRARQLGEIHELRRRLDAIVSMLALNGVAGMAGRA
jgi:hypothetical protein